MAKEIKTFEDFQKKKEEQLQKQRQAKIEPDEEEEIVSYPEIFAEEEPRWISKN